MANGVKNYMWFPVLIALSYTIYSNDVYRDIAGKFVTGDLSGAYEAYLRYSDIDESEDDGDGTARGGEKLFTSEELGKFKEKNVGLYLAIVGSVFDVTEGEKHYGPGETYHGFVGRDVSLAFVKGEFNEESLTDDISGVTDSQAKSIDGWIKFYHEKYTYKGKLIGRFYNKNGEPTADYYKFEAKVQRAAERESVEEERKRKFPPCNVEWKPEEGTRVWCTKQSGGISREWVGVPRQYFETPSSNQHRCACVNVMSSDYVENRGNFREYTDCTKDSNSCYVKT